MTDAASPQQPSVAGDRTPEAAESPALAEPAPVEIDRTLVIRLKEASDEKKKEDGRNAIALEWVKVAAMPLATVAITLVGGHYFSNLVQDQDARQSNERLYAQLLTQREQSDALIRKDMFGVVITRFLAESNRQDWSDKVLQLELLASNFNQSLDLAPLFKDLAAKLPSATGLRDEERKALRARIDRTASTLILKQVSSLARRGHLDDGALQAVAWENSAKDKNTLIERTLPKSQLVPLGASAHASASDQIKYSVEVVGTNRTRREIEVRLRVDFSDGSQQGLDTHFWVSQFDFPMLDNHQLPYGLRAAVVITDYNVTEQDTKDEEHYVQLSLVMFPAASASFKERQDYDDILLDMLRNREASAMNVLHASPSGSAADQTPVEATQGKRQ